MGGVRAAAVTAASAPPVKVVAGSEYASWMTSSTTKVTAPSARVAATDHMDAARAGAAGSSRLTAKSFGVAIASAPITSVSSSGDHWAGLRHHADGRWRRRR